MKKIFISQRVEIIQNINERRDALSQEWSVLARACGFVAIPVPNSVDSIKIMLDELVPDGIILTGGNDLSKYGGDSPERDETESALVEYALKKNIPLMGVCRGMQMLLDYFGAKLEKVEGHVRTVHILDNGRKVNSFHSWAAKECPECIKITARSEDGCAEEMSHTLYSNVRGVMWHPERYNPLRAEDINQIREFFGI